MTTDRTSPRHRRRPPAVARVAVATAAVCALAWGAWLTLCAGASRMISEYALTTRRPDAANAALSLTPSDPEAAYALAKLLADAGDANGAISLYERAITSRPRDYVLWVELGETRDAVGDATGATEAFREAVRLAPFYAAPRWQFGNTLLREGKREEAFGELRRAAESDPTLYPNFLQTVWYADGRDARTFAEAARPETPAQTLAVSGFLIKAGAASEGMRILRESGASVNGESKHALLANLLNAGDYSDAYEVWSGGKGATGRGAVTDGGFEDSARTDDEGFGWQFARDPAPVKLSLDADSPREGAHSLRVEFNGNSDPAAPSVSQLVLVEPGAQYRLSFSARTRDLVTGGLPFVQISSALRGGIVLAISPDITPGIVEWRDYSFEFTTPAGVEAVLLTLKRHPCTSSPCPAFGNVWLDSFGMKKF